MDHSGQMLRIFVILFISYVALTDSAWAGRKTHLHFGMHWGHPMFHYRHNPFYPVAPIMLRQKPEVIYVEQSTGSVSKLKSTAKTSQRYWYYCIPSKTYYPYVKQCEEAWQKVLPAKPDSVSDSPAISADQLNY